MEDAIKVRAQHAVESAAGGLELLARFGDHRFLDQSVGDRIGRPGEVSRAGHIRGLRAEVIMQLLAGRPAHQQIVDHDVEIEFVEPLLELRGVDDAHARIDAEQLQILDEGLRVPLEQIGKVEELEFQRLAVGKQQRIVLAPAAGRGEEVGGALQQGAILARAVGNRRRWRLAENALRQFVAEGLKQRLLGVARRSLPAQVRRRRRSGCAFFGAFRQGSTWVDPRETRRSPARPGYR